MNSTWYRGKFPPSFIEAIALHTLLYTFGFPPENIFALFSTEKGLIVALKQDGKQLGFPTGSIEVSQEEASKLWIELTQMWNTGGEMSKEEKDAIVSGSKVYHNKVNLVAGILSNGLPVQHRAEQKHLH